MKISVTVKTRSSHDRLSKNADGTYVAYLKTIPVKGEANRRLIELLSEEFDLAKIHIRIVKGTTSKNKLIQMGE